MDEELELRVIVMVIFIFDGFGYFGLCYCSIYDILCLVRWIKGVLGVYGGGLGVVLVEYEGGYFGVELIIGNDVE